MFRSNYFCNPCNAHLGQGMPDESFVPHKLEGHVDCLDPAFRMSTEHIVYSQPFWNFPLKKLKSSARISHLAFMQTSKMSRSRQMLLKVLYDVIHARFLQQIFSCSVSIGLQTRQMHQGRSLAGDGGVSGKSCYQLLGKIQASSAHA